MTQQQTHRAMYIVGFIASISLVLVALNVPYTWRILLNLPLYAIGSIFGVICMLIIIIAPFRKQNVYLFAIIIIASITSYTPYSIYRYFFDENFSIVTVGNIPGIISDASFFLLDLTGLVVLALRIYGYIDEHRSGLKTQF
jgi:hypothetical protein